jgi:flagella basal body P-ring formation protein FlgA
LRRRAAIVLSARADISANRPCFCGHIRVSGHTLRPKVMSMLAIVLFAPFARAASRALAWWLARLLSWAILVVFGLFGAATPAGAEDAPPALDPALLESVRALALANRASEPGAPRVEVTIGQLDPRLHLAPCQNIEPYVPVGMRLWGKARVGLRCKVGPIPWNVYLPITVKVWGRALVVPAGAVVGSILTSADLAEAEVDLAEEFSAAIVEPKLAVGRVLAQNLKPGQTLRQAHLKIRQWFAAGETVKVVATGEGFSLESEAQALSNGLEGQPARVRTDSGRVLTGVPAGERRIEVSL